MSMLNDISWGSKDDDKECEANLSMQRNSEQDKGLLGPVSEKKWSSISEDSPQGEWDKIVEQMMVTLAESGHPVFRATGPLSRGVLKSKGGGKLSIHYCADHETIETVFRTTVSVNQLSLYGAVAEMCEEYESYHNKTVKSVVEEEFDPLFVPNVNLATVAVSSLVFPVLYPFLHPCQS